MRVPCPLKWRVVTHFARIKACGTGAVAARGGSGKSNKYPICNVLRKSAAVRAVAIL